jgi:hypothetical protein
MYRQPIIQTAWEGWNSFLNSPLSGAIGKAHLERRIDFR